MATDYTIPKEEYRALVAKLNEMRLDMSNLMSENAKLREQGERLFDKTLELATENEKLRELVRELWNCALQYHRFDVYRHEIGVDGCGIDCTANGEGCCACKLEQRMRELGVEP